MQRIIYKPKIKRIFNLNNGIYFIKLRGSIYFLKNTKDESINFLRKFTDYQNKTPKEFYNIINLNFLKKTEQNKRTEEKKKPYYAKMRIKRKKEFIKRLKEQIKQEELNLIQIKGGIKK